MQAEMEEKDFAYGCAHKGFYEVPIALQVLWPLLFSACMHGDLHVSSAGILLREQQEQGWEHL